MLDSKEIDGRKILIALKAGNELAFEKLVDLHFYKLYTFCFRILRNKENAEEIVHDALLSVWNHRMRIDENRTISPYLFTIARRLSLNALRNMKTSQKAIDELWRNMDVLSNETEETILLHDLMKFTENAVVQLPPQQQLVFRLSRYEGLNYDEIAEKLGLSKNTVKRHMIFALRTLRYHFEQSDKAYFILLSLILLK